MEKTKSVCWICELPREGRYITLPEENHFTLVCNKCADKIEQGKNLTYVKII